MRGHGDGERPQATVTAPLSHDVIVVGGGFAGVTAAREAALRGRSVLLLEARERLGGRTWTAPWEGVPIEYGGGWVHWHQPHTWSEITRAGLAVALSDDADEASWFVGAAAAHRHGGASATRSPTAAGPASSTASSEALPAPHDPLLALDRLARFDGLTIAQRIGELEPLARGARRAVGRARVAGARAARGGGGGVGAALARALGLQPAPRAVHRRPRHARRAALAG